MPHASVTIGSIEVIPLCDGWAPLPLSEEVPGVEVDWDAERRRFPWAFPSDDRSSWAWHVHAFVIRRPDGVVLVDTGIGRFGRPPFTVEGRIDDELRDVGVAPDDVTDVVLTHLHADHSGGVCRPDGVPRFSNARHHVHPEDWEFFANHRRPDDFTGRFAMAGIEDLGLLDLDPTDHDVGEGIHVRHAPGHTPGHRVVQLGVGNETVLLTGDLLHVPPQITHAAARSNHDEDPGLGAVNRAGLVGEARARGRVVGVSHFGQPFGRVREDGWTPI